MFCMHCGAHLPDDACFCAACGKPVEAPPAAPTDGEQDGLDAYLALVGERLGEQPRHVPEVGAHLFVTQRFSMALANIHQYFFIAWDDTAGYDEMQAYAKRCADWALANYQGLPRGMQKGVAVYAVLCQHPVDPGCVRLVKQTPKKHFGAFELPVVVDPAEGRMEYLDKTPVWGFAMWKGIKGAAAETLGAR